MKLSHRIIEILLILLVFSLFLPIRHIFPSHFSFVTGAYSDFTSFSLYLSDLLIMALLVIGGASFRRHYVILALIVLSFLSFLINSSSNSHFSAYFWVKILELVLFYLFLAKNLNTKLVGYIFNLFIIFGLFQSFLALYQFLAQKSLGLYRLGESHLAPSLLGVAKISLAGMQYIRTYGTFPHSNLLAAYLVTCLFFCLLLYQKAESNKLRIFYGLSLAVLTFGLFLTFSRASMLAFAIGVTAYWIISFWKNGRNKNLVSQIAIVAMAVIFGFVILKPFLLTRATISDEAVLARETYNKIGVKIIKSAPVFGVGPGLSVLHMKQFSPVPLQPWEIQPIHNYYLLAVAELGIPAALLLILFFLYHLFKLFRHIKDREQGTDSSLNIVLTGILLSYLILMLFDHYFWTIEQTQLLLWLILGMIGWQIRNQPAFTVKPE